MARFTLLLLFGLALVACPPTLNSDDDDEVPDDDDEVPDDDDDDATPDRSVCLSECAVEQFPVEGNEGNPLQLSPIDTSLGPLAIGQEATFTFVFTNTGEGDEAIYEVLFPGPIVCNTSCPAGLLRSGESAELSIQAVCSEPGEFWEDAPLLDSQGEWVVPVRVECI